MKIHQVRVRTEQGITKCNHILGWKEHRYYSALRSASFPHGTDKNNTEDRETDTKGKTLGDLKRKTGPLGLRINQVRVRTEQGITKCSHILGWKEHRYYSALRGASFPHGTDKNNTEDKETDTKGKPWVT